MYNFYIPLDHPDVSLRDWIRKNGISLTQWRKIKAQGIIKINNLISKHDSILHPGDNINISLPLKENYNLQPQNDTLNILFEDNYLLIVSKPSNMLVHPTCNQLNNTLGNIIMGYYQRNGVNAMFHPVSRLDKNTSGIIIIAKTPQIQHLLSNKKINKSYLAIMPISKGFVSEFVDKPIARKQGSIIEREVNEQIGKSAQTKFTLLANYKNYGLMNISIFTGRTHQIRVHAAYIGMPLLGDDLYGGNCYFSNTQLLHAHSIDFIHPITKQLINIRDYLPEHFKIAIEKIKRSSHVF